jgi:hypothetical protein
MKQPKSESSREMLRKIKEAAANSGISHDPDFARRRASEGQAVETLSDVVKGTKQNIAARPILEKAESLARQQALVPKPVGKISQYADDAYKAASKLGGVAKKLPFKKLMAVLGPVGAAIGTASDAMASDDLGAGEDAEVMKMRQEAMMPKDQKLEELKAKMAEMASKPLPPMDLLQNTTKPMIKELGGPADINPKMANGLLGEQDSPDYESGLDPVKEIARRKKQFGY